jgi:hypothetical protein
VLTFRHESRPPKSSRRKVDPAEEARLREEEHKAQMAAARAAVQEAERTLR